MDGGFCVFAELTVLPEQGTPLKATPPEQSTPLQATSPEQGTKLKASSPRARTPQKNTGDSRRPYQTQPANIFSRQITSAKPY